MDELAMHRVLGHLIQVHTGVYRVDLDELLLWSCVHGCFVVKDAVSRRLPIQSPFRATGINAVDYTTHGCGRKSNIDWASHHSCKPPVCKYAVLASGGLRDFPNVRTLSLQDAAN